MNINFEAALHLINLGAYDQAVKNIQKAIEQEKDNGDEKSAIEYICVLGDLFSQLGEEDKAKTEFDKVIEYCDRTNSLPEQKRIAEEFVSFYNLRNRPNTTQTSPYEQ